MKWKEGDNITGHCQFCQFFSCQGGEFQSDAFWPTLSWMPTSVTPYGSSEGNHRTTYLLYLVGT